jgi:hypothetical protein
MNLKSSQKKKVRELIIRVTELNVYMIFFMLFEYSFANMWRQYFGM